jgi:hypothetical protein
MKMNVPENVITVTKEEAATRQTVAAIEALERGEFDIAITLAGAAEGMFERERVHLFSALRDSPKVKDIPRKEWIATLNLERDWLKHSGEPERITLDTFSAAMMIARAASKLEEQEWTPPMERFKIWFLSYVETLGQKLEGKN